jgi:hypothetical protein
VFVNNYNRGFSVTGCKFTETGDSAICFVGDLEKTKGTQRALWRDEQPGKVLHEAAPRTCGNFRCSMCIQEVIFLPLPSSMVTYWLSGKDTKRSTRLLGFGHFTSIQSI